MGKVILWLVVAFLVLFGLRLLNAGKARRRASRKPAAGPPAPMVRCLGCGVFLPRAEATPCAGGHVCGDPACRARRPTP